MSIYAGRENPQGWRLRDDVVEQALFAARRDIDQVYWPYSALDHKLKEKHQETVFVTAHAVTKGGLESFWYDELVHCRIATLDNFRALVAERWMSNDFAIHRTEDGGARDHGFLFRVVRSQVPRLYTETETRRLV